MDADPVDLDDVLRAVEMVLRTTPGGDPHAAALKALDFAMYAFIARCAGWPEHMRKVLMEEKRKWIQIQ